jgi:hypothetical protein
MKAFPGQSSDYLITTDSDLWPLRREHYIPRPGSDIVLVHSACCGYFSGNNKSYQHLPMSNIGASVSTWLQITNDNHSIIARDAESILDYLQDVFGEMARNPVVVGQPAWYMDKLIVSIRIAEWMENHPNRSVHRVSDSGFSRIDRPTWDAEKLSPADFSLKFDTHLLLKGYLPSTHARIKPLIHLMYGNGSWETKCDRRIQPRIFIKNQKLGFIIVLMFIVLADPFALNTVLRVYYVRMVNFLRFVFKYLLWYLKKNPFQS